MTIRGIAAATLFLLLAASSRAGDAAFQRGDFEQAAREYRRALESNPTSATLHYNLAATLLQLGRYEEARQHLATAVTADDPPLRRDGQYNAGNADLFPALRLPAGPERDAHLRRAIEGYRQALILDADDLDAKWNLELAERLLSQPEPAGGGGGGGAGGGGGLGQDPAAAQPTPEAATADGPQPRMSPAEAEEVLNAAASRDRELHQQKLQRGPASAAGVRDW